MTKFGVLMSHLFVSCLIILKRLFKKPGIPPLLVVFSDNLNDQVCNNQNLKSSSISVSLNCIWNPSDCLHFITLHLSKHHHLLQRLLMKEELNFPVFLVASLNLTFLNLSTMYILGQMIFFVVNCGSWVWRSCPMHDRMFGRCSVSTL